MPLVVSSGGLMKEKPEGGPLKMEEKIGKIGEGSS